MAYIPKESYIISVYTKWSGDERPDDCNFGAWEL